MDRPPTPPGRGPHRVLVCGAAALALALSPVAASAAPEDPSPAPSAPADDAAVPQILDVSDAACAESSDRVIEDLPWTHGALGLDEAHALSRGEGVTVAVLASGLDAGAPALEDAVTGGGTDTDCRGYGTFLAGIVAARPRPDSGFVGVAPGARILGVATGDPQTGEVTAAQLAASLRSAVESEARVVLVGTAVTEGSAELSEAAAAAEEAGVLVVAPASVWGRDGTRPGHPARESTVLAVAAHAPDGRPVVQEVMVVQGEAEPARVDLVAPGSQVLGIGPGGEGHRTSQGDGVAAAFTAGTAALLLSREPDLTPERLRERLAATAYPSALGSADPVTGSGRIDPVGALVAAPGGRGGTVEGAEFVPDPSDRGEMDSLPVVLTVGGTVLVVTLAALGRPVLAGGRARGWRPARPGERPGEKNDEKDGGQD
ncbi:MULTISPECIES: S8 family serine peptidase [unclassified Nocardiopsis]|uniref:S8 family serine peptidase n=1 Tax=Nocardiopsis TaxID=2013 RepID=UPI00387B90EE